MADLRTGLTRWVVFDGDRFAITGLLAVGTFLLLATLGYAGVIDLQDQDAVRAVAGGFVPGLIAFLSIVLGINQLVLSQEFGSAGEIRERVQSVREYRRDVEDVAGTGPSPVLPVGFLSFVVETIQREAVALEAGVGADVDDDVSDHVRAYAATVREEAGAAQATLDDLRPGRINALLPVLEYDDSQQLYEARRLKRAYGEHLPAEAGQALDRLTETLELFSVARTQFRTTYTQRVLAGLSRQLLYLGIPALVAVVVLGLLTTAPPSVLSGPARPAIVSALFAFALSPLLLLASYLLRIAAVSERTIAAGPFVSRPGAIDEWHGSGPANEPTNEPRNGDATTVDAEGRREE